MYIKLTKNVFKNPEFKIRSVYVPSKLSCSHILGDGQVEGAWGWQAWELSLGVWLADVLRHTECKRFLWQSSVSA